MAISGAKKASFLEKLLWDRVRIIGGSLHSHRYNKALIAIAKMYAFRAAMEVICPLSLAAPGPAPHGNEKNAAAKHAPQRECRAILWGNSGVVSYLNMFWLLGLSKALAAIFL